ncbi:unnamed protein product [Adineta steineri]|uniref:WH1 domain-containing protein n=1 Tax=Adineta steineri TaxID=433720 RepID=A0A819JLV8_9BILA|nr:unnamed protein product [Adineta steineri]CAF1130239.1 unnamed protein product [Adineta steineri]CAF3935980.1 unnamed protein product [Adineta steineri]
MHLITTNIGQQAPLYTCKAHIFQVDPDTRKYWIQLSTNAVNVQIFHDSLKNVYRILSVDGAKVFINTIITNRMNFTKTSQKFCQWVDSKANQVYGLGFANENDLTKFINKFITIKQAAKHALRSRSVNTKRISHSEIDWSIQSNEFDHSLELKKENAHLKLALVQSSNNVKSWQEELEILRNNNVKLTTALQESHANVEEWKKQLHFYRDECSRLRQMVFNRRSASDEQVNETKGMKNADLCRKEQEKKILQLEHQAQHYTKQIHSLKDRLIKTETINQDLRNELQKRTLQDSNLNGTSSRSSNRNIQQLLRLRDVFELKTNDFNHSLTSKSQDLQQLCSQITQIITEF